MSNTVIEAVGKEMGQVALLEVTDLHVSFATIDGVVKVDVEDLSTFHPSISVTDRVVAPEVLGQDALESLSDLTEGGG